jgi:proteic killer suppression protein
MLMEVGFGGARLARVCTDPSARLRRLGEERAKKLLLRLNQMSAATSLAELFTLPQARCRQVVADRDEQFSLDLGGPYRLVIEVADEPTPRLKDGGIDLDQVQGVIVIDIIGPHGRPIGTHPSA